MIRILILAALLSLTARAADRYVEPVSGVDSGSGAIGSPWKTIAYGVANMAAGDTLWLRGGTYEEPRLSDGAVKSGPSNSQRTTISGYPGEIAKYKPTLTGESSSYHVFYLPPVTSNVTFSSFWIDGANHAASYRQRYMIYTRASVNLTITNMVFTNAPWNSMVILDLPATSTFVPAGSNTVVSGCTFARMGYMLDGSQTHGAVAMYPKGHVDIVISNNVFKDFSKSYVNSEAHRAIQMTRSIDRATVVNNWIQDGNSGITLFCDSQSTDPGVNNVSIRNNVITNMQSLAFQLDSQLTNIYIDNNTVKRSTGMRLTGKANQKNVVIRNNIITDALLSYDINPQTLLLEADYYATNNLLGAGINPSFTPAFIQNGNRTGLDPAYAVFPAWDESSPARNTGTDLSSLFAYDYYGTVRPQEAVFDIGAYEWSASGQLPTVRVTSSGSAYENGLAAATFTFTRAESNSGNLTVNFTITGTATPAVHYVAFSDSVVIPDGDWDVTATVTPLDVAGYTGNKTVIVTIDADAAYTLAEPISATIEIVEGDYPTSHLGAKPDDPGRTFQGGRRR